MKIVCLLSLVLLNLACDKACSRQKDSLLIKHEAEVEDTLKDTVMITAFPSINFLGLNDKAKTSLIKFLNEEICPCGCPKTFAQCVVSSGCKPAQLMLEWMITKLKQDVPEAILYKAISQEINAGFLAKPLKVSYLDAYKKGSDQPKVSIVEFADFECPACKNAAHEMKDFIKNHEDDVAIYFMHFPLSNHLYAEASAIASEAAGLQGKFWPMHDLLFKYEGLLNDEAIKTLAQSLFNKTQMKQFAKDIKNPDLLTKIKAHKAYAHNEVKIMGTPSFLFNGRPYYLFSAQDAYALRLAMEKAREEITCH